jgi:hypothetical protein
VNQVLRFLLLILVFVALPAFSQGYTLNTPRGWTLEWKADKKNKSGAPNAEFTSATDRINASISIMQGRDASVLSVEQLREVVMSMAADSVPKSMEGKADIRTFGQSSSGMYIRLTDKEDKTQYKYITFAIHRKGKDMSLGLMTSNDHDAVLLTKFLGIFDSVVVNSAPMSGSSTKQPVEKGKSKSANAKDKAHQNIVWGAIATDTTKGETDPYYGIGEGDTRAEAEQDAIGLCREEGAKVCVVRIAYTQCGAYAASASGSGTGTGVTRREAEAQALSACKGRQCEIVASDCN